MSRSCAALFVLALFVPAARADLFDFYTNPVLNRLIETDTTKEVKQLTPDDIADNDRVLPNVAATFLVVKTNDGRNCKLLVQVARQKLPGGKFLQVLQIERYVTYREGEEQTVHS